jgi:inorganic phosphate transporter, PiT family
LGVSFARGANDTPKIAAIGLAGAGIGVMEAGIPVVIVMALGGLFAARRVTETMSWRVTRMDASEGLGGNLVTTGLVLGASGLALPVSTTHVSCGALFGIAAANRTGQRGTIAMIALAWGVTMPLGALLGILFHYSLNGTLI